MHSLEPYYAWRNQYCAEEDPRSPFFGREYSEFEFSDRIYDHYIHPQWDSIDSTTLFMKLLFTEYDEGYCIIELIGEWNDTLYNDIMTFKRNIIDLQVALIHVSVPDKHGYCSLGVSVEATLAAIDNADYVIAQVNKQMPRTHGAGIIHFSEINAFVELPQEDRSSMSEERR